MGRMVDLAVLESATSGVATLRVGDQELMQLCVLADEWDALYMQAHPEAAKTDFGLEGMLHWFLEIGAGKLQLDIANMAHILENQNGGRIPA